MSTPGNSLYERIGGRVGLLKLLRYFYADVRQHAEIAPIFAAHIEDWPAHLEKLADFWSGILGGPRLYSGAMPWKHVPLQLEERHFTAWLGLWSRHSQAHFASAEASELIAAAETIGQRLRQILAQSAHATHKP
jgi:hemoglobin